MEGRRTGVWCRWGSVSSIFGSAAWPAARQPARHRHHDRQRAAGRRRAGIVAHQASGLLPRDIETIDGFRCTSLARTLLDLAAVLDRRGPERVLHRAEQLHLLDLRAIEDILARNPTHQGAKRLRGARASHHAGSTLTKTEIEELFLQICRGAGLPQPEVNVWLAIPPKSGRSTSSGAARASSSKPTDAGPTARPRPSNATADATNASPSKAGASSASPGARSPKNPIRRADPPRSSPKPPNRSPRSGRARRPRCVPG